MKAIARFSIVCVVLAATRTPSTFAGLTGIAQGTGAAMWSTAQQDGGSDAERRQAADQWLKRARQAIKDGNLDLADDYASRAEKLGANYDSLFSRFSDSPAKVRRDLAEARKSGGRTPATPSQRFAPSATAGSSPPAAAPRSPGVPAQVVADEAKVRAQRSLESGRQALKQGAINEAIAWRQKAISTGAVFAPGEYSPADLGRELQQAGVEPARLEVRPASPAAITPDDEARTNLSRLPMPEGLGAPPVGVREAAPAGNIEAAKEQAVRLTARARAALDRGELELARQLVSQAESLRVPEFAFNGNDLRPWDVALQIDSALSRRQGVVPAGNFEAVPAAGNGSSDRSFPVAQGLYNPNRDGTRNSLAQNQAPAPILAAPSAGSGQTASAGVELFQRGMAALNAGDRTSAVAAFQEAWRYEQELPPDVRQQLKDKLLVLTQANNPPAPAGGEPAPLEEVSSQQQLLYQKMYREIAAEEQAAEKMTGSDPRGALQKMTSLRDRVAEADLEAPAKKQLLTFVDRGIKRLEAYIQQNKGDIELNERNQRILNEIDQRNLKKFEVDDTIAAKVDEFNKLMEQERYAEAELVARQVRELAPDNPISRTLLLNSKMRTRLAEQNMIKDQREGGFYAGMTSVEESATPFDDRRVIDYGDVKRWKDISTTRGEWLRDSQRRMSPAELQIRDALKKQVEVRFDNRPLKEVLETLGSMTGVNVFVDTSGLAAEGITSDTPVSINLSQPISLQSALNVILQPLQLGYVIRNEVLHITSEQAKDSNTYQKTYYVADLIVPIPNFVPSYNMGLPAAIREAHQTLGYGGATPMVSGGVLPLAQNDAAGVSASVLAQAASPYSNVSQRAGRPTSPNGIFPGSMGGAALADFDTLIELIKSTIAPDSWDDAGGPGAIESFPTNLSLVISQTQDVHDQIADLLEQLRRLQDLQVAIEVRFITIRDSWFERIGVDFDFRINDNVIPPLRRDDQGPSMAIGLTPSGTPTADLDIPFSQDSFSVAIPQFGGYTATNAANFGVAILSDIEAFFLVQASTGDRRSNVLTAPKVTLFNGQSASVNDTSQRPFVIGLIPVVGDFAVAHQPVVTVLNEGTQLGVQAVVSSDRRYVRLTLVPFFSQIGDVQEFTFSGATTTDSGTNVVDADGKTIAKDNETVARAGTTIQLPTFSFTTVSTTVSVPDGGTVLLGGIKRLSEGRNEFGVPGLNKLPYVNRLFKNVGIGRDTSSLMLMVTPRIIIQEEEEDKLGTNLNP